MCLRLAWVRNTLPVAVTLKRFATAFFVLRLATGFGIRSGEPKPSGRLGNKNLRRLHDVHGPGSGLNNQHLVDFLNRNPGALVHTRVSIEEVYQMLIVDSGEKRELALKGLWTSRTNQ